MSFQDENVFEDAVDVVDDIDTVDDVDVVDVDDVDVVDAVDVDGNGSEIFHADFEWQASRHKR